MCQVICVQCGNKFNPLDDEGLEYAQGEYVCRRCDIDNQHDIECPDDLFDDREV